jgi:hypothetical protein
MIQLTEIIPVETPLGSGYAIIFEGRAHDNYWTVALENCAIVTFRQDQIRIARSYTHSRSMNDQQMKEAIK